MQNNFPFVYENGSSHSIYAFQFPISIMITKEPLALVYGEWSFNELTLWFRIVNQGVIIDFINICKKFKMIVEDFQFNRSISTVFPI